MLFIKERQTPHLLPYKNAVFDLSAQLFDILDFDDFCNTTCKGKINILLQDCNSPEKLISE